MRFTRGRGRIRAGTCVTIRSTRVKVQVTSASSPFIEFCVPIADQMKGKFDNDEADISAGCVTEPGRHVVHFVRKFQFENFERKFTSLITASPLICPLFPAFIRAQLEVCSRCLPSKHVWFVSACLPVIDNHEFVEKQKRRARKETPGIPKASET